MNTVRSDWYVPPAGPLYDFDDSLVDAQDRMKTRRWLVGFNGRVGEPADNVQLGWRAGSGGLVAVGTFHPRPHEDTGSYRFTAAFMLDGVQFHHPGPPSRRTLTGVDHLRHISQDDDLWRAGELSVDAIGVPCSWASVSGATILHTEDGSVVVASRSVPFDRLRVRTLPQPTCDYPVDPWRPQSTTALNAEWEDFFEDRPDLVAASYPPEGRR